MKKLIAIICVIALLCPMLCACNRTFIDTTFRFTEAIIIWPNGEEHVKIKSWCDYENSDMVQITLEDGAVYLTHSSNVILISP